MSDQQPTDSRHASRIDTFPDCIFETFRPDSHVVLGGLPPGALGVLARRLAAALPANSQFTDVTPATTAIPRAICIAAAPDRLYTACTRVKVTSAVTRLCRTATTPNTAIETAAVRELPRSAAAAGSDNWASRYTQQCPPSAPAAASPPVVIVDGRVFMILPTATNDQGEDSAEAYWNVFSLGNASTLREQYHIGVRNATSAELPTLTLADILQTAWESAGEDFAEALQIMFSKVEPTFPNGSRVRGSPPDWYGPVPALTVERLIVLTAAFTETQLYHVRQLVKTVDGLSSTALATARDDLATAAFVETASINHGGCGRPRLQFHVHERLRDEAASDIVKQAAGYDFTVTDSNDTVSTREPAGVDAQSASTTD